MTEAPDSDVAAKAAATLTELIEGDADDPTFDAPWQARAFALAVAVSKEADWDLAWDWHTFQERFIDRIQSVDPDEMQRDVETVYYEQWLATLEELVVDADLFRIDELERRQNEFEAGDRDESEFVLDTLPDR